MTGHLSLIHIWGDNGRMPVEEVANRVNSTLEKYPVNKESSVEKFGVNADKFGDTSETQKKVSKTAQKIIDLVISDPSITDVYKRQGFIPETMFLYV